jgi:hypothetical protein
MKIIDAFIFFSILSAHSAYYNFLYFTFLTILRKLYNARRSSLRNIRISSIFFLKSRHFLVNFVYEMNITKSDKTLA